ncbi:MAG: hypothetical protein AAGA03_17600, partial [Planctomycetota bacterium]
DDEMTPDQARIMGVIYGIMGAVFTVAFLVGLAWSRGIGGWVYNLILIALGLTSCCTWPATIPLIIYWIKAKDYITNVA